MNLEEKNRIKRKNTPLPFIEKLPFFFFPEGFKSRLFSIKDINDAELERFKKYGFERKFKDALSTKKYGTIFYFALFLILLLSSLSKINF